MSRLPGMGNIRPPRPLRSDEAVAVAIATRIVSEVNLDDFYWEPHQVPKKVDQMAVALMNGVFNGAKLIRHLHSKYGDWCLEGVAEHCDYCGPGIEKEEVAKAVTHWKERYEVREDES